MRLTTTPTTEILESLVGLLDFDIEPTSVTDNLDGTFTITTCNTYHLQPNFKAVTINAVDYPVVSVTRNINIVVSGTIEPPLQSFPIYQTYYFHGIPERASGEISKISTTVNKTPMAFLSEAAGDFEETYFGRGSANDREAQIRLFFLTYSNIKDYTTDDYHSKAIVPMTDLALEFIEKCRASVMIGKFDDRDFKIKPLQNVYIKKSGGQFANESLSGVELNITLPIVKGAVPCPCNIIVVPSGMTYEDLAALTYEDLAAMAYEDFAN